MKAVLVVSGELAILPGEDSVRFIAFPSPFDRMQRPVCEGKVCQVV
jgi:hypothetical protein